MSSESFQRKYSAFLFEIIDYLSAGKHPNLAYQEEEGLLSTYGRDVAVSWMNALHDGKPVIPRSGFLVEFNHYGTMPEVRRRDARKCR